MKRTPAVIRLAATLFAPLLVSVMLLIPPGARAASSAGGQVDVNFFVDNLKDQGSWFTTNEYGDVWQPYIAYKNSSWRPYTDGYWTYTDGGWMFVSYEAFGWAVYHYGRWTHLKDVGWAWVPGTEWAPAWVAWRSNDPNNPGTPPAASANIAATSTDAPAPAQGQAAPPPPDAGGGNPGPNEDYIGWAPLPPEAVYNDGYAYGPTVDVDFGIDPYDYCFTSVGLFGAPWLGGVIFGPDRGYWCCGHSVNITNFYYNRRGAYRGIFVGGPNFARLQGRTGQPLQQLRIDRQFARSANQFARINGRTASVFAPHFARTGVLPNGRVQFNRQPAIAHADVLPGGQRGGGGAAQTQTAARETFARQAQEFRQNHAAAGGGRVGAVATPNGVEPAKASAPQKEVRTASRTNRSTSRGRTRSSGSNRTAAGRSSNRGSGHTAGGRSGGGHSGGGHAASRGGGGAKSGGGGKKH